MMRALAWFLLGWFVLSVVSIPDTGYQHSIYAAIGWRFSLLLSAAVVFAFGRVCSRAWDLLFVVAVGGVVVSLPMQIGYSAYGRADVPFHHAVLTQLRQSGHLPDTVFYPAFHALVGIAGQLTGTEADVLLMAFPVARTTVFIVLAVFALRALSGNRANGPNTPSTLLILSSVGYLVLSSANAFADVLVIAAVAVIPLTKQASVGWRVALTLLILSSVYAHPIAVVVLTIVILGMVVVHPGQGRARWAWLATLPVVLFAEWFSSFGVFRGQLRILWSFLVDEGRGTPVTDFISNIERAAVGPFELAWIGFRTYGGPLLIAAAFAVLAVVLLRAGGWRAVAQYRVLVACSASVVGLALVALVLPIGGSLRYVTYATVILAVGYGVFAADDRTFRVIAARRALVSLTAVLIWTLSVLSLFNDPYRRQANEQVSRAELSQYQFVHDRVADGLVVGTIASTRLDRIMGWLPNTAMRDLQRYGPSMREVLPPSLDFSGECGPDADLRCIDLAFLPKADLVAYPEVFLYPSYAASDVDAVLTSETLVYTSGDGFILRFPEGR